MARARSVGLTTLARTLRRGPKLGAGSRKPYHRLEYGPGEPHQRRLELSARSPRGRQRSLLHFVHYTDMQIADAQSPVRGEWIERYSDLECASAPLQAAFRPQETLTLQAFEQTIRTVRQIAHSPVSGFPIQFAMCTGDNIDNQQFNELRWFVDLMDGLPVRPNSGGKEYEGVQSAAWENPEFWHPEPVPDKYKQQYGFPEYPGLLREATRSFRTQGVGIPWYSCFGNHDGLIQGNIPKQPVLDQISVGQLKSATPPPGVNPCDEFETFLANPQSLFAGPAFLVTPDEDRRILTRRQYIEEHFRTRGSPRGHGFAPENRESGLAYYVLDEYPGLRMIVLDTTNPGGFAEGSIGAAQLAWLEEQLTEVHSRFYDADGTLQETRNQDQLVVLFSHHGLGTLNNPVITPDPFTPEQNDLPRIMAPEIETLVHRFPNVVLWVVGHTHRNEVVARPDPDGRTNGFWEVTTSAIMDWPCQTRLIEILANDNSTLSIFGTMVDHGGPADPEEAGGLGRLASIFREVSSNDPQAGIDGVAQGKRKDRNVELVIPVPFRG
ncbi:MAG: TIGR03767 family metallophosphoesterase [Actinomycetota bacterium]